MTVQAQKRVLVISFVGYDVLMLKILVNVWEYLFVVIFIERQIMFVSDYHFCETFLEV